MSRLVIQKLKYVVVGVKLLKNLLMQHQNLHGKVYNVTTTTEVKHRFILLTHIACFVFFFCNVMIITEFNVAIKSQRENSGMERKVMLCHLCIMCTK